MAIQARDLGVSEQRDVFTATFDDIATGNSSLIMVVPYPCVFAAGAIAVSGLSGAPQYMFKVNRLASGGATLIAMGISNMIGQAVGTSGYVGFSGIQAAGSTLLMLQLGDVLILESSVANTAALEITCSVVLTKTQDIVKHFGLST